MSRRPIWTPHPAPAQAGLFTTHAPLQIQFAMMIDRYKPDHQGDVIREDARLDRIYEASRIANRRNYERILGPLPEEPCPPSASPDSAPPTDSSNSPAQTARSSSPTTASTTASPKPS